MGDQQSQQSSMHSRTGFRFAVLRLAILGMALLQLLPVPATLGAETAGRTKAVDSIRLVLPPKADAVTENTARIFARQVTQRCGAQVSTEGGGALRVTLAIEPGLGTEGFRITPDSDGSIRIVGNDARGLLYGVGKFLRSSRYDQGGFTPGSWRGTSVPEGSVRCLDATAHFMNFYEAAPIPELQAYIEDVALWGANEVSTGFPTWDFKGFDDPEARRSLEHLRALLRAAKATGLQVGLGICPNQGFTGAPAETRAQSFPDGMGRRGFFGVNCCPSKPAGHEYLLNLYGRLLDEFKDVGLDGLCVWPYDEGGCGCADCWPWGCRGFPTLSRNIVHAAIARARNSLLGNAGYPDATFSLRLSFGVVKGYEEDGKPVPAFTTFAGLYERAAEMKNRPPFDLPPLWGKRKSAVDLKTPLNFVSTCDLIGGNSGSPVVNRAGEFVGVIFDGNLQSLPWDEQYSDAQGRSIAVDSRGILEALEKVYRAKELARELVDGCRGR
jgi:hypothetical protein